MGERRSAFGRWRNFAYKVTPIPPFLYFQTLCFSHALSFDKDGTKTGYDLNLVKAVAANVNVPVIASGGASTSTHMKDALAAGADAVLAASIFHYGETTVTRIKQELLLAGIPVRPFNMRKVSFCGSCSCHSLQKRIERRNVRCIIPSIDIMGGHAVQLVGGGKASSFVL